MHIHSRVPIIKTAQPDENLSIISIQYWPPYEIKSKDYKNSKNKISNFSLFTLVQ